MNFSRWTRFLLEKYAPPASSEAPRSGAALSEFLKRVAAMSAPRVLELGTLRSINSRSTMHRDFVPHAAEFLGTDLVAGADVDIVADVHRLSDSVGVESFDVIVSCSTFEHLKYPHVAAHEIMKALRRNGLLFIQTHQTFPLHAYPYDYFRFSREALAGVFGTQMGFEVLATNYEYPAAIWSHEVADSSAHPAFLNVNLVGRKTAATPDQYVFEFDYAEAP